LGRRNRMQIDRIDEWRLTPDLDREIATLLDAAFGTGFDGRSFYKQRHHLRLTARDGGRLIGHMALGLRAIRLDGDLTDIVGLAEVATHPDTRGRGVASELLKEAIGAAEETMAPFLLLFGTAGLYAAHGFRPVDSVMRFTNLDDAQTRGVGEAPATDLMVRELGSRRWPEGAKVDLVGWVF